AAEKQRGNERERSHERRAYRNCNSRSRIGEVRYTRAMQRGIVVLLGCFLFASFRAQAAVIELTDVGPASVAKCVEIRGVGAGPFDPKLWESGTLNLVPDERSPLLSPKVGPFRNIYAP